MVLLQTTGGRRTEHNFYAEIVIDTTTTQNVKIYIRTTQNN